MKVVLEGAGARRALRAGVAGRVLASFPRACYLDLPRGLVALVGPDVHPGPLHLVIDRPVPLVARDAPAAVTEGGLVVARRRLDRAGALAWAGLLPPPDRLRPRLTGVLQAVEEAASTSALHGSGPRAADGLAHLVGGDLERAAGLLAGLGPGLTPAGDDVLAGAVFLLRAALGPEAGVQLRGAVARLATGRISRAFLAWAACGQALAPAHDLLAAVAAGETLRAGAAAGALARVGATSGADFALGLQAAARCLSCEAPPTTAQRRRRTGPASIGVRNRT